MTRAVEDERNFVGNLEIMVIVPAFGRLWRFWGSSFVALIALLEFITNLDQMLSPVCEVRMWSNTRAEKTSPDKLLFLEDEKKKQC